MLFWSDIAFTPVIMMAIASFVLAKADVQQGQLKRASTASRVRLSSVTVSDTLSGISDDIEASDVWSLLAAATAKEEPSPPLILLMAVLELAVLYGFPEFVKGNMGVDAVTPAYMDTNSGSFTGMALWALVVQTLGCVFGVVFGIYAASATRKALAATDKLVSSKPPILSFRHAGESVLH